MIHFSPPKKKLFEVLFMFLLGGVMYLLYPSWEAFILFVSGFIWNWSVSIEHGPLLQNRRYRFSFLRSIISIQNLFLKPFIKSPKLIQGFISILPAGVFWWMVIYLNESTMPWWATFLGSCSYVSLHACLKKEKNQPEVL